MLVPRPRGVCSRAGMSPPGSSTPWADPGVPSAPFALAGGCPSRRGRWSGRRGPRCQQTVGAKCRCQRKAGGSGELCGGPGPTAADQPLPCLPPAQGSPGCRQPVPRGLGPRGQGSLEQERRWKQYLEDERIALFLQNEEFMKELQRNRDFLLALERGEEHRWKPLAAFWPCASLQDRGPAVVAWPVTRRRRAGCGQGRGGSPTCQHRAAGFVPALLLALSHLPRGSAPPAHLREASSKAQQICGEGPWQCPPSPTRGDSQHGFTGAVPPPSPRTFPLPLVSPCCCEGPPGREHRRRAGERSTELCVLPQGSDRAGLGAFCLSDRLKYESKKSKSSSVAVSNDFGFSSVISGNFKGR